MPEKLKVELSTDAADPAHRQDQQLRPSRPTSSTARRPRASRSRADMRVTVDAQPFPAFANYTLRLGRTSARSSSRRLITLDGARHRRAPASRASNGPATRSRTPACRCAPSSPARVFEPGNGRATKTDKTLPMRTRDVYLGIRPTFEGRYAREGADTEFDIVAVDADGKQVADQRSSTRIERIDYDYQWYQSRRPLALAERSPHERADRRRHDGAQGRCSRRASPSASSTGARTS